MNEQHCPTCGGRPSLLLHDIEVNELRQQLELSKREHIAMKEYNVQLECAVTTLRHQLADEKLCHEETLGRINELETTIRQHGIPVKTYAGGEAHYCTKEEA